MFLSKKNYCQRTVNYENIGATVKKRFGRKKRILKSFNCILNVLSVENQPGSLHVYLQ